MKPRDQTKLTVAQPSEKMAEDDTQECSPLEVPLDQVRPPQSHVGEYVTILKQLVNTSDRP